MRRVAWSVFVGVVLASTVVLTSTVTRADEHARASLDYETLDRCLDKNTFAAAIATRLGYDPFEGSTAEGQAPPRKLVVRYRREGKAAFVTMKYGDAEKNLASQTGACDELGASAAFAAAILIDPRAMFPRPPAKTEPAPPRQDGPPSPGAWPWYEPPPLPKEEPPKEAPPAEPWHPRAGLSGVGCAGCAPSVNAGGMLFVGLARGAFGIDLGARADATASAAAPSGRDVSASLVLGELFPHVRVGPTRLGVVGHVGSLLGESGGVRQSSVWSAAGARVAVEWAFARPFFLRAALDGELVLSRVALRADDAEVWSSTGFVAGLGLGVGAEF